MEWTGSITTEAVGCEFKFAVTLPESFTDGATPRRPSQIGYGRNSILPPSFRPARNTSPLTRRTRSSATTASLLGIRLSFKRWSRPPCGHRKWILTTSRNDFPRGSMHSFQCTSWHNLDGGRKRESNLFTVGRLQGCRRRARLSREAT